MATTTATITLTSTSLMDNNISISNTMTLTDAGTATGISETTGLAKRTLASDSKVDLITFDNEVITASKSAKVYIKNTGTATDKYVQVLINSYEIGRLYGGDWMLMPYLGGSGEDIEVQPSDSASVTLEYIAFYE